MGIMKKILLAFFVLLSFSASSQVLQKPSVYGYQFRRVVVDTLFAMPSDTFSVPATLQSFPFVARKGASLYYWNGSAWVITVGGSTNIYNSDGTLTGNRTVTGGGFDFTWNNMGNIAFNLAGGKTFNINDIASGSFFTANGATDTGFVGFRPSGQGIQIHNNSVTNEYTAQIQVGGSLRSIYSQVNFSSELSAMQILSDSIRLFPYRGNLIIDSLNYTLSTVGKKIMLRDTATGLVQNIDPSLLGGGGTPAGNYGNVQLNRNGAFDTPGSDSLEFESATGLTVKGNITSSTLTSGRVTLAGTSGVLQDDDNFTFNTTDNELLVATTTDNGAYKFQLGGDALFNGGSLKLTTGANTRIDYNTNAIYVFANSGTYIGTGSSTFAITAKSGNVHIGTGNDPTMRLQVYQGRFGMSQGTDVASAAGAISLSSDGNTFEITGTAAITLISNANWQNGSVIHLIFTSTATLTDGTANSGTDIGMELAGNANFTASADDVVTLVLSEMGGTQRWREVSRSVN